VRAFLKRVTLDDLFESATWRELSCLVQIEPDNDVLPVRARYGFGNEWQIGLNPFTSQRPVWYTLADVVAAKLLSGKVARVIDAVRLVPRGRLTGMKPIELRSSLRVDPKSEDFFQRVIELRKGSAGDDERLGDFLKVLANSASYGIFAEMNRDDQARKPKDVERFGLDRQRMSLEAPEEGGRWCFPPLAASIAGAARLMLAMLERCVTDAGGSYVFCDTDSMAIVATEAGELVDCTGGPHRARRRNAIRALSWAEVDAIVTRFDALKLYDPAAVRDSVLKIEDENYDDPGSPNRQRMELYCYAISAKRYCLFNLDGGQPVLRKSSESGLGHLMDPLGDEHEPAVGDPEQAALPKKKSKAAREWIQKFWERTLREAYTLPADSPDWFDRIALSRFTVSTASLLDNFESMTPERRFQEPSSASSRPSPPGGRPLTGPQP
jgi:hypothetical protein